jgi:hypothetical protein
METDCGLCCHYSDHYRQAQRIVQQTLREKSLGWIIAARIRTAGLIQYGVFS